MAPVKTVVLLRRTPISARGARGHVALVTLCQALGDQNQPNVAPVDSQLATETAVIT